MVIPKILSEMGVDPTHVLRKVGIEPGLLTDSENTISFVTAGQLFQECVRETGCAHFGLLAGQGDGAESLGIIGIFARQAPDVGTALQDIVLHLHLQDRGAVPSLTISGDVAVLGYAVFEPGVVATDQIYDIAMAIAFNILRELCGPAWLPVEVLFSHSKPPDAGPFRQFFQSRLRFDAEQTALVFHASWLKQPLSGANRLLRQILEDEIKRQDAAFAGDLPTRLRRVLRNLLVSGRGSMAEVAQAFALHRRTLNRRLSTAGTSFNHLVEEVRFEIAHQFLRDTDMPLADIAAMLDYADTASFTRAFRRWSGTTPGAWRAAIRSERQPTR